MKLSARNQFMGTVSKITEGQAMAEVTVKVGVLEVVAAITEGSGKNMGLKVNDARLVAIKATEDMIGKWGGWAFEVGASCQRAGFGRADRDKGGIVNWLAIWVTFKLACLTAGVLLAVGLPIAYWLTFSKWRWKFIVESVV